MLYFLQLRVRPLHELMNKCITSIMFMVFYLVWLLTQHSRIHTYHTERSRLGTLLCYLMSITKGFKHVEHCYKLPHRVKYWQVTMLEALTKCWKNYWACKNPQHTVPRSKTHLDFLGIFLLASCPIAVYEISVCIVLDITQWPYESAQVFVVNSCMHTSNISRTLKVLALL